MSVAVLFDAEGRWASSSARQDLPAGAVDVRSSTSTCLRRIAVDTRAFLSDRGGRYTRASPHALGAVTGWYIAACRATGRCRGVRLRPRGQANPWAFWSAISAMASTADRQSPYSASQKYTLNRNFESGGDGTRTHEPPDCQSGALPAELRPRSETSQVTGGISATAPRAEPSWKATQYGTTFAGHPVRSGARP